MGKGKIMGGGGGEPNKKSNFRGSPKNPKPTSGPKKIASRNMASRKRSGGAAENESDQESESDDGRVSNQGKNRSPLEKELETKRRRYAANTYLRYLASSGDKTAAAKLKPETEDDLRQEVKYLLEMARSFFSKYKDQKTALRNGEKITAYSISRKKTSLEMVLAMVGDSKYRLLVLTNGVEKDSQMVFHRDDGQQLIQSTGCDQDQPVCIEETFDDHQLYDHRSPTESSNIINGLGSTIDEDLGPINQMNEISSANSGLNSDADQIEETYDPSVLVNQACEMDWNSSSTDDQLFSIDPNTECATADQSNIDQQLIGDQSTMEGNRNHEINAQPFLYHQPQVFDNGPVSDHSQFTNIPISQAITSGQIKSNYGMVMNELVADQSLIQMSIGGEPAPDQSQPPAQSYLWNFDDQELHHHFHTDHNNDNSFHNIEDDNTVDGKSELSLQQLRCTKLETKIRQFNIDLANIDFKKKQIADQIDLENPTNLSELHDLGNKMRDLDKEFSKLEIKRTKNEKKLNEARQIEATMEAALKKNASLVKEKIALMKQVESMQPPDQHQSVETPSVFDSVFLENFEEPGGRDLGWDLHGL